jgi:hypothetical protein
MRISIMQPYIFPYIGYFQLIRDADIFVVYDDVNYTKRSWITRNRILLNKTSYTFSLHTQGASSQKKINEIDMGDKRKSLVKTLICAYRKAPHFSEVMPLIEDILMFNEPKLALYLMHQLQTISAYLGLQTKFILSSGIPKNENLAGQEKILSICKALNADAYSNAIGGQHLYSAQDFLKQGIDLKFIKSDYIEYPQFGNDFAPWLSIIDVLMFNSNRTVRDFLTAYQRIS